mmetsp:Transcript_38773/g.123155  ORF Transcript_38773/g.123155 Transcript_38773/m.123155 type:complete len:521 (-) Transcript_38773:2928-4490(-)
MSRLGDASTCLPLSAPSSRLLPMRRAKLPTDLREKRRLGALPSAPPSAPFAPSSRVGARPMAELAMSLREKRRELRERPGDGVVSPVPLLASLSMLAPGEALILGRLNLNERGSHPSGVLERARGEIALAPGDTVWEEPAPVREKVALRRADRSPPTEDPLADMGRPSASAGEPPPTSGVGPRALEGRPRNTPVPSPSPATIAASSVERETPPAMGNLGTMAFAARLLKSIAGDGDPALGNSDGPGPCAEPTITVSAPLTPRTAPPSGDAQPVTSDDFFLKKLARNLRIAPRAGESGVDPEEANSPAADPRAPRAGGGENPSALIAPVPVDTLARRLSPGVLRAVEPPFATPADASRANSLCRSRESRSKRATDGATLRTAQPSSSASGGAGAGAVRSRPGAEGAARGGKGGKGAPADSHIGFPTKSSLAGDKSGELGRDGGRDGGDIAGVGGDVGGDGRHPHASTTPGSRSPPSAAPSARAMTATSHSPDSSMEGTGGSPRCLRCRLARSETRQSIPYP